ncbi:MAG: hypothetical protein WDN26_21280 [Chitinophagaceae bacterium]
MASTSETGHAKNIANFEDLISFCTGYGAAYNPGRENLTLIKLQGLYGAAQNVLQDTKSAKTAFDNATNNRRIGFADLQPFAARLVNALTAFGASELVIADAKAINKKIQGARAKEKPAPPPAGAAASPAPKTISTSQQSYDSMVDHFTKMVEIATQESSYTPNEPELKITGLQTKLNGLKAANTAVSNTYTAWSNARITRDNTLYNIITGLVPVALDVKKYIKSIFGPGSPQAKQLTALDFKVIANND